MKLNKILLFFLLFSCQAAANTKLSDLSLEEKVGQLLIVHFKGETANRDSTLLIEKAHVGGFIYYNWSNGLTGPSQVWELSQQLQKTNRRISKVPLFIAIDQEGGRVSRLKEGFTPFPSNREVALTGCKEIAFEESKAIAKELKAVGVNINLAPVVDINSNPSNPIIGDRSYGPTADEVMLFAEEAIRAYQSENILCVLKHFPGHGDVASDSHATLPIVDKSLEQLYESELIPFKRLYSKVCGIMSAHILVPQVDASPASISSRFLTEILRRDWDYKGLVISDSIVMKGITSDHDSIERVALAMLNAGTDLLCLGGKLLNETAQDELTPQDVIRIHSYLVDCVKQGTLSEKRLNESVQRILDAKEQYARLYEGHLEEVANIDSKLLVEEIRLLARLSMKFSYDLKKKIAQQIWQNECGSSYDKLLFWNENERFLSLGIAHMIWYPEGVEKSFEEGFPNYIDFLKRQGFEVPDWLQKHCPWKTREEFVKERKSIKALELASWLQKTFDLQGLYLLHRLQTTLHKILKEASIEKRQDLLRILDTITASPAGLYALIDYVNFKGSGLIPTETYQGKGWGLCQVLAELSHDESRPVIERFTESAQKALINRVANAPSKEEEKWLKGWLNRVQTYLYFECN